MLYLLNIGTIPDYNPPPPPLPPALWHVPLSLGLWAVSVFLLLQGIAFLRWVTKDQKDAPDPGSGFGLAVGLTIAIFLFFYAPWLLLSFHQRSQNLFVELIIGIFV